MIKKAIPRFNLGDVESRIASEFYCDSGPSTFCLITLKDNLTSLGESTSLDDKKSDRKTEREFAKQDAIEKLRQFMSKATPEEVFA